MPPSVVIELSKEAQKFSAGHFTIFGPERRERLHGHNFTVTASLAADETEDGLAFDYSAYKTELVRLCGQWNEAFLLPGRSPHLELAEDGEYLIITFAGKSLRFLQDDAIVLPVVNVTLEELSRLLLDELVAYRERNGHAQVRSITVKVFSGPGQCAIRQWEAQ